MAKHTTVSIRYQIAQKVRSWRLKRKYTLKDLVEKTGINYHTLIRYEQGTCGIPIERLKVIANALSIPIRNLFPRRKVLKESCCFDEARSQEMYNFIEKTGGHKAIYALTKSVRAEEESNIKAARIRIAKGLVKAGFDTEIIYRTTGLSIEEYADKERYEPNGGQEIKKWRIIRGYTQEELAKKLNVGPSQIHHYEQGSVTLLSERLWEIARELSVDAEDLIKEYKKNDCEGTPKVFKQLRLFQIDFLVKDKRSKETGWVAGTFIYDGAISNKNSWFNMKLMGVAWGNDPNYFEANYVIGKRLLECWINPDMVKNSLGYLGRLNGPIDNKKSSCLSCHSTAQHPEKPSSVAPEHANEQEIKHWFRNLKEEPFDDGAFNFDYSKQLSHGVRNYYNAKKENDPIGCKVFNHKDIA